MACFSSSRVFTFEQNCVPGRATTPSNYNSRSDANPSSLPQPFKQSALRNSSAFSFSKKCSINRDPPSFKSSPFRAAKSNSDSEGSKQLDSESFAAPGSGLSEQQVQNQNQIGEPAVTFTPFTPLKWGIVFLLILGSLRGIWSFVEMFLLHPKFLMYLSWFLVLWPWPAAIGVAILALKIALKQKAKKASQFEQFVLLAAAITWLILVPLAHFQGYVDGWPLFLSIFYFLFFSASSFIRLQLYGDLSPKEKDEQWKTPSNKFAQIAFVIMIVGCHWYAAKEAFCMEKAMALRDNISRAVLLFALWLHYTSFAYLGKYFDRLVVPKAVVVFGPYRIVRHPIYTSYMLLFAGYCLSLRSYVSMCIVLATCLVYYHFRTEVEEGILVKNFRNTYLDYKKRVDKKFIPFLI